MNTLQKAKILGDAGRYDSCGPKMCEVNVGNGLNGIYYAKAEHKTCRIFKTLMDNTCKFDCKYCANSTSVKNSGGSKVGGNCGCKKKVRYEPKELADLFMYLHHNLDVNGLFLSSGVSSDPNRSTERMIEAVKILRQKRSYRGYIHFKVLPGTNYDLVKQASEMANRMSINIEAPNKSAMSELSDCKDFKVDILRRQSWISRIATKARKKQTDYISGTMNRQLGGGQATQLILNRISSDKDVLKMVDWEYKNLELKRIYYSSFRPVKGTPLEKEKADPISRQNHLYNVDFLMRCYGFKAKEFFEIMVEDKTGLYGADMLPNEDPKLALAKATFDSAVDINEASYEELIRIPGIGPTTAKKIVNMRNGVKIDKYISFSGKINNSEISNNNSNNNIKNKITRKKDKVINKYEDLHKLGGWVKRAKPFISVNGMRQMRLGEVC
ncbi:MAG: helix-hairpin-helix domain-containing protein [Candidatus Woesearchaeota archaeon]